MERALFPEWPILIIDDERRALQSIAAMLRLGGINNVIQCEDSRKAMAFLQEQEISIVLLDLSMPHISGQELLPKISEEYPQVPVVVVTGINDLNTAVSCMTMGAFDYMVKPVEQQRMLTGIRRAVEVRELRSAYTLLKERMLADEHSSPEAFSDILTVSPKMFSLFHYAETIAQTSRSVLITGETGVGKELFARGVHRLSGRSGPFVAVNVAGLDDAAFSDTLFGHARGAFTGADTPRAGLIRQAQGGAIFLDEIGDLRLETQVKLLRLLQEREYYPLGADAPKRSEARVILATHCPLEKLVQEGSFRKDLYYRLQVHRIQIPPLRERIEDLPVLLDHFLEGAAQSLQKSKPTPPRELLSLLANYAFPGNIRELEAMVFDAVSRHEGRKLSMKQFKAHIRMKKEDNALESMPLAQGDTSAPLLLRPGLFPTLSEATQFLVRQALKQSDNNQTIAAELLGITPSALNKRLKRAREEQLKQQQSD